MVGRKQRKGNISRENGIEERQGQEIVPKDIPSVTYIYQLGPSSYLSSPLNKAIIL
jgi:hypothetical protein